MKALGGGPAYLGTISASLGRRPTVAGSSQGFFHGL